jgi:MFS family permease
MDNNSNIKQPKLIRQQAIYSLILGIISIILPWLMGWYTINFIPGPIFLFVLTVAIISEIIGLIFGKKGLKLSQKTLAIAGIAACSIGFLSCMYILNVWLMIGGLTDL